MKSLCTDIIAAFTDVWVSKAAVEKHFKASVYIPSLSVSAAHQVSIMQFTARHVNQADTRQVKKQLMQILADWLNLDSDFKRGRPASHLVF